MMDESRFEGIKKRVIKDFVKSKLITPTQEIQLQNSINVNSSIEMFCPKCKYSSIINIYNYDDHVTAECETCLQDFPNLEFQLKEILFFDIMQQKRREKRELLL